MHGLGNDFILVDDREGEISGGRDCEKLAAKLCDRHLGIGADGLIFAAQSKTADMAFKIYNSDGSRAAMCGNGIRCFAKFLYEKNICRKKEMLIEAQAGSVKCFLEADGNDRITSVKVDMGAPSLIPADIPALVEGNGPTYPIRVKDRNFSFVPVSMGNPHAVIFTESVDLFPVASIGPAIETHEFFPERTNVEFVEVLAPNKLRMRVWERGAGITMACGTGACASLVAARLTGRAGKDAEVFLPGGVLSVSWDDSLGHIFMTGPAEEVFEGNVEV